MVPALTLLILLVPHTAKASVVGYGPDQDPSDPPLSPKGASDAFNNAQDMYELGVKPDVIYCSTRLRGQQTAHPFRDLFPEVPYFEDERHGQPDSGEKIPGHPNARPDDMVLFGPVSGDAQWRQWFIETQAEIWEKAAQKGWTGTKVVTIFTHSPFPAVARYIKMNGPTAVPGPMDVENLIDNGVIRPYLVLERTGPEIDDFEIIPREDLQAKLPVTV